MNEPKHPIGSQLYIIDFQTRLIAYAPVESALLFSHNPYRWGYRFPGENRYYDQTCLFQNLNDAQAALQAIPIPPPPEPPPSRLVKEGVLPYRVTNVFVKIWGFAMGIILFVFLVYILTSILIK